MITTTNCDLCGDNRLDNSEYCEYCNTIMDITPKSKKGLDELILPIHKKKTLTAIIIFTVCIIVMMILASIYESVYKIIFPERKTVMMYVKNTIILLLLILIIWGLLIQTNEELRKTTIVEIHRLTGINIGNEIDEGEYTEEEEETSENINTDVKGIEEDVVMKDVGIYNDTKKNIELKLGSNATQRLINARANKIYGINEGNNIPVEEERELGEVFHVSDNSYTYNEARAICKKYGASLATPTQIYKMYTNGTSWCKPGWSEGQHVLFPATRESVDAANSNEGTKGSCGKVGLNGMFELNTNKKYGANCWKEGLNYPLDTDSSGI